MTKPAPVLHLNDLRAERAAAPSGPRLVLSTLGRGDLPVDSSGLSIKFVLDGEEIYEIDGRRYRLQAGDFIVVDAGATGQVILPRRESTIGLCAFLTLAPTSPLVPGYGPVLRPPRNGRLGRVLREMTVGLAGSPAREGLSADALLASLAGELSALAADTRLRLDRLDAARPATRYDLLMRLERARAHLHDRRDRAVPLDELTRVAGLSAFHLARHFTAAFGEPPGRYHRRLRLEHAAELIRRDELSPTEAALRFGYADLPAFTRAFRAAFGHPPSALSRHAGRSAFYPPTPDAGSGAASL